MFKIGSKVKIKNNTLIGTIIDIDYMGGIALIELSSGTKGYIEIKNLIKIEVDRFIYVESFDEQI